MARNENKRKIKRSIGSKGFLTVHRSHVAGSRYRMPEVMQDRLHRQLEKLKAEIIVPCEKVSR